MISVWIFLVNSLLGIQNLTFGQLSFCSIPSIQKKLSTYPKRPPHPSITDFYDHPPQLENLSEVPDLTEHFETLAFRASLGNPSNSSSSITFDFGPVLKTLLLKKYWKTLSSANRKRLLRDAKYQAPIQMLELDQLPGKAPFFSSPISQFQELLLKQSTDHTDWIIRQLQPEDLLLFLYTLSEKEDPELLQHGLTTLCYYAEYLPSIKIRRKNFEIFQTSLARLQRLNKSEFLKLLYQEFPLKIPKGMYDPELGRFFKEVEAMNELLHEPTRTSEDTHRSHTQIIQQDVMHFISTYRGQIDSTVEEFLDQKRKDIRKFHARIKDKTHFFTTLKRRALDELLGEEIQSIQEMSEPFLSKNFSIFSIDTLDHQRLVWLWEDTIWRKSFRGFALSKARTLLTYFTAFYLEETSALKQLMAPLQQDLFAFEEKSEIVFSKPETLETLFHLSPKIIVLPPWFKLESLARRSSVTPHATYTFDPQTEDRVILEETQHLSYRKVQKKTLLIAAPLNLVPLATFLDQTLDHPTAEKDYLSLFPSSQAHQMQSFLQFIRLQLSAQTEKQEALRTRLSVDLTLGQKVVLDQVADILSILKSIHPLVEKHTTILRKSNPSLTVQELFPHFTKTDELLQLELTEVFRPFPTLPSPVYVSLRNKATLLFLEKIAKRVPLVIDHGQALTLQNYLRFQILVSLDLEHKTTSAPTQNDHFELGLDRVAERLHRLLMRRTSNTPFTQTLAVRAASRILNFLELHPASTNSAIVNALQTLQDQTIELVGHIKDVRLFSSDPERTQTTLGKMESFFNTVHQLKLAIHKDLLKDLPVIPYNQYILRKILSEEIDLLFFNANHLARMMNSRSQNLE